MNRCNGAAGVAACGWRSCVLALRASAHRCVEWPQAFIDRSRDYASALCIDVRYSFRPVRRTHGEVSFGYCGQLDQIQLGSSLKAHPLSSENSLFSSLDYYSASPQRSPFHSKVSNKVAKCTTDCYSMMTGK